MIDDLAHLPNWQHMVRILESLADHRELWIEAWMNVGDSWPESHQLRYEAAVDQAVLKAAEIGRRAEWYRATLLECNSAMVALAVYDHSANYLKMSSGALDTWATLSDDPAAILLQYAVYAQELVATRTATVDNNSLLCYNTSIENEAHRQAPPNLARDA